MAGRVKGAAGPEVEAEEGAAVRERPLRPGQCREYMRRELARAFPGIVQGFVQSAKKGNCQHVKLATELMAAPARAPRRGKSTVERLIEQMESGGNGRSNVGEDGTGRARAATGRYT